MCLPLPAPFQNPDITLHICSLAQAQALPPNAHRVDCTDLPDAYFGGGRADKNLLAKFRARAATIDPNPPVAGNTNVFVNCQAGRVRSAIVVGLYLRSRGQSAQAAMATLAAAYGNPAWPASDDGVKVSSWVSQG